MRAKDPPRTATHKPAKKAITRGYVLNTARVRKKKRRDVNTTVAEEKVTTNLSSMTHVESDDTIAEEESKVVYYEIALENRSSPVSSRVTTADTIYTKQHNL